MNPAANPTDPLAQVTLAIIAGGQGRRMGKPKAWLRLDNVSMLAWMLNRLNWAGPTMLITAPAVASPPDCERFDYHLIDPVDGLGPMRGVLTALQHAPTEIVLAIAVDMPLIQTNYLKWLSTELSLRPDALGLMGTPLAQMNCEPEPFPAAYRSKAATFVQSQLENGRRSLRQLCKDPQFVSLPIAHQWPSSMWTNLNDPTQYQAFESAVASGFTDN